MSGAYSGGGVIAAALSFGLALMVFAASFGHIQDGATFLTRYGAYNGIGANGVVYHGVDYVSIWQGILIEFIVTFVLVTVILMVALDTKSKTGLAPVLIGFT